MPTAGTATHLFQRVDEKNSTNTPLANGETFTGGWVETLQYPSVIISIAADQDCDYRVEYSTDYTNIDSTIYYRFRVDGIDPPTRLVNTRAYYRVVVENNSGSDMTYLRLQVIQGHHQPLNSTLDSIVTQDSDALIVRTTNTAFDIAQGRYQGKASYAIVGTNPDIDGGSVPEDISAAGTYAGFPTGAAETLQAVSTSASDTGDITVFYLPDYTSEEYESVTVTMTGTTPVSLGVSGVRAYLAIYDSKGAATYNAGVITVRHAVTTANVFCTIPIGFSKSQDAVFTIPANSKGFVSRIFGELRKNTASATAAAHLYARPRNSGPFRSRPLSFGAANLTQDQIEAPELFEPLTDLKMIVTDVSTNNSEIVGGFDITTIRERNGA